MLVSKSTLQSEHGNCAMAPLLHRIAWTPRCHIFSDLNPVLDAAVI